MSGQPKREGSWDELSTSPPLLENYDIEERRPSITSVKGEKGVAAPPTQFHAAMGVAGGGSPVSFGLGGGNGGATEPARSSAGMMAKPKFLKDSSFVEVLTSNVASTMSGWLTYLPASVSKSIPVVPEESQKPKILWSQFQRVKAKRVDGSQAPYPEGFLYLVLGYADGFQVWDCSNIEEIREVLSVRDGATRSAKFLEFPVDEVGETSGAEPRADTYERFEETRPHLAVVSTEPSQKVPWSSVKIYSLKTNEVVHVLRFKSEVHNLYSNSRILIVCLHDNIFAFDAKTYKNAFGISGCQPNPHSGSSVVALGVRWLAYATSQPMSRSQKQTSHADQASFSNHPVVGVAKEMATDLAQNLYHWGDKGFQAMANYFSGTADERTNPISRSPPGRGSESPKGTGTESAAEGGHGTIMIRDVTTRSAIAHFQAHNSPISAMAFNPNGSLLVTASSQGHEFCVYQILPNVTGDPGKATFNLLYRLKRGVYTNAVIEDISFSLNCQWVAVSSARGTTHLFPINPLGGLPTVYTHTGERTESSSLNYKLANPNAEEPITVPALGRIHQPSLLALQDESQTSNFHTTWSRTKKSAISSYFVPRLNSSLSTHEESTEQKHDMGLFLVNPYGILSFHLLSPQVHKVTNKVGQEDKELKLQTDELIEWNLVRGEHFGEVIGQFERIFPPEVTKKKPNQSKWLSNVEVTTHAAMERPIWLGPQFVFKTFQGGDAQDGDGEAIITSSYDEEALMAEDELPSRSLEFRTTAPVPYREDPFDNDPGVSIYSMSPTELAQNLNDALEDNLEHSFTMSKSKSMEPRKSSLVDQSKDLNFEDDALVVGGPGSLPNSFKNDWEKGSSGKPSPRHKREGSSGDEFENLAREAIGSPDGDNELGIPNGSVFLG